MDALSALRFLPRKPLLCFVFSFAMFSACALYTLFADTDAPAAALHAPLGDYDVDVAARPPDDSNDLPDNKFRRREVSNVKPINVLDTSPLDNPASRAPPNHTRNNSIKRTNADSVHADTKYVYLPDANASSTASTRASPDHKATTAAPPRDTCRTSMEDPKLILLWTSFFDYWDYLPREHFERCERCRNCVVTRDRSRLLESDAVIFHARDMSVTDMPPVRLPHQRWIFYCLESPPYSDFPGLQHMQNMFNWTMTYRSDSDIAAPYGYVSKVRPPRNPDLQSLERAWSNKSRSVVWLSSHCPTHGGRDAFARELARHIDVDVYGSCGDRACPRGRTDACLRDFARRYKFFLAFENSLCADYVTEKFFRTLRYDLVPVVFGGARYGGVAPPGSFVDALGFRSPRHLAFFLGGVGRSFKLYSSFFRWRGQYEVHLGNGKECQLCEMLHRRDAEPKSYGDLRDWWVRGSDCKVWSPKI